VCRGAGGGHAGLWLNEVEHGFGAGCMVGWWGAPLCEIALRTWALGEPTQRARFEAATAGEAAADHGGVGLHRLAGCVPWQQWLADHKPIC